MIVRHTGATGALVLFACMHQTTVEGRADSSSTATSSGEGASGGVASTSESAEGASGGGEIGGYEDDGGADGCAFACPMPGGGGTNIECDLWSQDCPEGEKCMPWANDGGGSWNATRCAPIDPDPAEVGDACLAQGSGVSGLDNCGRRAMCWSVDSKTNAGVCVALCVGTEASHGCEDAELTCVVGNGGVLPLCLRPCDPLAPICVEGEGCYPAYGVAACVPNIGGDGGAYGEPCEFINACDPGLACAAGEDPQWCPSTSCCSTYCDLDAAEPDAACPDADLGQTCVPLFELGQAPSELMHVGLCS